MLLVLSMPIGVVIVHYEVYIKWVIKSGALLGPLGSDMDLRGLNLNCMAPRRYQTRPSKIYHVYSYQGGRSLYQALVKCVPISLVGGRGTFNIF